MEDRVITVLPALIDQLARIPAARFHEAVPVPIAVFFRSLGAVLKRLRGALNHLPIEPQPDRPRESVFCTYQEEEMNSTYFEVPVIVLVGLGFPRKVESAIEAYQLLSDMRLTTSKAAHKVAMQACKAAIDGTIDPETAKSAFVAFARRNAMLVSNDPPSEPNRAWSSPAKVRGQVRTKLLPKPIPATT